MRTFVTAAACAALAAGAIGVSAQAPVREGLQRAGDAVIEGTGSAVQDAGQITRDAGQAAVGAAQGAAETAGQAARSAAGAAAGGVRGGIDRLTPGIPLQARTGDDQGRDARWRFQRHNGEWWYYTQDNNWMYHRGGDWQSFAAESYAPPQGAEMQASEQQLANQPIEQAGEHTMGYRGDATAAQPQASGQAHSQLFVDRCGRHYVCENGQRVYVSIDRSEMASSEQGYQESWSQPTPAEPSPPADAEAQAQAQPQDAAPAEAASPADPAPPVDSAPPAQGAEANTGDAAATDVPAVSDRPLIEAPASPREVNNAPNPAPEGQATTGGATDSSVR